MAAGDYAGGCSVLRDSTPAILAHQVRRIYDHTVWVICELRRVNRCPRSGSSALGTKLLRDVGERMSALPA
jgi:hypothetical protein